MEKSNLSYLLEEWLMEQRLQELSDNTLKQYKNAVLRFIEWLPEGEELNKFTTMNYKKDLENKIKDKEVKLGSVNVWLVSLNKFLKWLKYNDHLQENITVKKFKVQQQYKDEDTLTKKEYMRLKRFALNNGYEQLFYILETLGKTGCRLDELKYFTVENLELTPWKGVQVYNKGKWREVPVIQTLSRSLKKFYKSQGIEKGIIFLSPVPELAAKGKMVNPSTIFRQMKKVAGMAKIKKSKVHPHNFRHYFGQRYSESYPEDSLGLADILGHNDLKTTRIYLKTSGNQQRRKIEKVKF